MKGTRNVKTNEYRAVVRVLLALIAGVWVYAAIACLLLALSGCGGGDADESEPVARMADEEPPPVNPTIQPVYCAGTTRCN